MKKTSIILATAILVLSSCTPEKAALKRAVDRAGEQLLTQVEVFDTMPGYPRSMENGGYRKTKHFDWTCGFFPGSLWLEYLLTGEEVYKDAALKYTERLSDVPEHRGTHDLGFMVFCSYGKQHEVLCDSVSAQAVVTASKTLCERFDPQVGLIRSWDFGEWNYPVIVDNMMNLEMLFWASAYTGDDSYRQVAISHADNTLKNHFREDASSYHVVSYNSDGSIEKKQTWQGYSDDSAWARGQGWGLYGYTVCYRYTGEQRYLDQAKRIAAYLMSSPGIPQDKVPYWDLNAPGTGNELADSVKLDTVGIVDTPKGKAPARDASAAAIIASALIELSHYVEEPLASEYMTWAKETVLSLASDSYLSKAGENGGFVLVHSTGAASLNSEIDVPINYADYYFLEAIYRLENEK
ncbi:MAG: glycoside hydrolase family 88 protein [Bacteroidales bacterium]|nr:glycoside hydrolase family 88 protein [Bacteroidales bacterium]